MMEYLIFGSVSLILFVVLYFRRQKQHADNYQIRSGWGKSKKKESYNFISISRYAGFVKEEFHRLSDQTMNDIDFHRLFIFIDRTTSKVGQQYLYKKTIEPSNRKEDPLEKFILLFGSDCKFREVVQSELLKLSSSDAYFISSLLGNVDIEKPKWLKFVGPYILLVSSLLILSFFFPYLLIILILLMVVNMYLHVYNRENTMQFSLSIPQLNILIEVSKQLEMKGGLLHDSLVKENVSRLKAFQNNSKFIRFRPGGFESDLAQYVFDVIKVVFLIEVFSIFKLVTEITKCKSSIRYLFEYVGKIDTAISVASLRAGKLETCSPRFTGVKKELIAKGMYHPLLRNCVDNSILMNKGMLITGSNMSGKSTFLRTLMINSILAQTIYTCFAKEFITPLLKQFSSIRMDDNLFEGKSYYFQEVSIMAGLIAEAREDGQCLFVLDEIFKGTNTVERISAAKAILSYLNYGNNLVAFSTHDIELAEMLQGEFELYHFTETIESETLRFDHKIKSGQLSTRNAIRLLELSDFPVEITEEARKISSTLKSAK